MTGLVVESLLTPETRARVAVAWEEYGKAVQIEGISDVWDKRVIDRVIYAMAAQGHPFSVNDFRELLPHVRNCLISHRLRAAMNAGVIERVGKVPSDLKSTHGHEINVYRGTR